MCGNFLGWWPVRRFFQSGIDLLRLNPRRTANAFQARPGGRRAHDQATLEGSNDARTGMPPGIPRGAMCVQRFDDSLNSAIHITYRISLRSSSMPEPRDPLLKVLTICVFARTSLIEQNGMGPWRARGGRGNEAHSRREGDPRARQSNKGRIYTGSRETPRGHQPEPMP